MKKKCFVTAVPVDETRAGLNRSFFPPILNFFTSLHHPLFSVSFHSGVSFPHASFFFYSQFTIFCVVSQFHLFKGRDQHLAPIPVRIWCWWAELGKVASAARGSETCASKFPWVRECVSYSSGNLCVKVTEAISVFIFIGHPFFCTLHGCYIYMYKCILSKLWFCCRSSLWVMWPH